MTRRLVWASSEQVVVVEIAGVDDAGADVDVGAGVGVDAGGAGDAEIGGVGVDAGDGAEIDADVGGGAGVGVGAGVVAAGTQPMPLQVHGSDADVGDVQSLLATDCNQTACTTACCARKIDPRKATWSSATLKQLLLMQMT